MSLLERRSLFVRTVKKKESMESISPIFLPIPSPLPSACNADPIGKCNIGVVECKISNDGKDDELPCSVVRSLFNRNSLTTQPLNPYIVSVHTCPRGSTNFSPQQSNYICPAISSIAFTKPSTVSLLVSRLTTTLKNLPISPGA